MAFSETFYIAMIGLVLSFTGLLIGYCLKSKCKSTSLCFGLIQVERDTTAEIEEQQIATDKGIDIFTNKISA